MARVWWKVSFRRGFVLVDAVWRRFFLPWCVVDGDGLLRAPGIPYRGCPWVSWAGRSQWEGGSGTVWEVSFWESGVLGW